ncbi:hypothetical protein RB595_008093 [Gaeumannomyces hyphopodioides]
MENPVTKSQLLRALGGAAFALDEPVQAYSVMKDAAPGLPDAFPVVANRLPDLLEALRQMETSLKAATDDEEKPEAKENYGAAIKLAEECRVQSGYLQDLFEAVEGATVEEVLCQLLEAAVAVMPAILGSEDALVEKLRQALAEVSQLKPSLEKPPKASGGVVTLNNYDKGTQFYHGGKGDQNHLSGSGVMITGKGATNHFGQGYAPRKFDRRTSDSG